MKGSLEIEGQVVDIINRRIYLAKVTILDGKIHKIDDFSSDPTTG